jgi:hypothetical protein
MKMCKKLKLRMEPKPPRTARSLTVGSDPRIDYQNITRTDGSKE